MIEEQFNKPTHIVGIGASAGGLEALQEFFAKVPANLGVAYVVVQHLSPDFKSMMDELLSKNTTMPTHQALEGEELQANCVYLIPAGKLMRLAERKIFLSDLPPDNRINLPINEFFRTLAEDAQNHAIGIVLSGTGSDGGRGVQALKEMGAMVIAQDPEEAKFDGMPMNAINTGSVDFVLKVADIPDRIAQFISHPLAKKDKRIFRNHLSENGKIVEDILSLIQDRTDLDFKSYKESTVSRRIEHRMSINSKHTLQEYWDYINQNPDEIDLVKQDLLIGVTQFFRDTEVWDGLYESVIKLLVENGNTKDTIRIWCPGCSTGEEAYSFAILFSEAMNELQVHRNITVFATDIDQSAIGYAANGLYPSSISSEVPASLLNSYFNLQGDSSYQINKAIRSMVVFATHNLIQDPPFSNMDVVSCRNTLIYLQTPAQQKVMAFFHFALKVNGILFLGTAESPGSFSSYFEPFNAKIRLYKKTKDLKIPVTTISNANHLKSKQYQPRSIPHFLSLANKRSGKERRRHAIGKDALINEYVPPTLITDNKLQVVYSFGDTSRFTSKIKPGHVSHDLSDVLLPELTGQAITAAHQSIRQEKSVLMRDIPVDESRVYSLKCFSFKETENPSPYIALSFLDQGARAPEGADLEYAIDNQSKKRIFELDAALVECQKLYREAMEELDTTSEELQSSNEELMAANEELQSTNEELQSVNEELYTVNSEYQLKIAELTEINSDLENLMLATNMAVLFLGSDLKIRRYTQALKAFVNIIEFDINRDFRDLSFKQDMNGLEENVVAVNEGLQEKVTWNCGNEDSVEVTICPYRIGEKQKGVIISMTEH